MHQYTQVVMAVAQVYHHIAPRNEAGITAKPLIRLLKNHRFGTGPWLVSQFGLEAAALMCVPPFSLLQ